MDDVSTYIQHSQYFCVGGCWSSYKVVVVVVVVVVVEMVEGQICCSEGNSGA
jgi:hypothetical protein